MQGMLPKTEAYSESSQTSKKELYMRRDSLRIVPVSRF